MEQQETGSGASVRRRRQGKIGVVVSNKMQKTIVVEV